MSSQICICTTETGLGSAKIKHPKEKSLIFLVNHFIFLVNSWFPRAGVRDEYYVRLSTKGDGFLLGVTNKF